jgi:hypothetical protein
MHLNVHILEVSLQGQQAFKFASSFICMYLISTGYVIFHLLLDEYGVICCEKSLEKMQRMEWDRGPETIVIINSLLFFSLY